MRSDRLKWVHIGVAVGLLAVGGVVAGVTQSAGAVGASIASSFVPITPCRLADTRPETLVGSRSTPIVAGESVTFQIVGTNGKCTIPASATGIASNMTSVNPTAPSFLTVYPADAPLPQASNLNWTASSPPTPNQVTVALSASGAIKAFNGAGTIDLIIDIVGYYQPATSGGAGPAGPTGATGPTGPTGPAGSTGATGPKGVDPANVIWVAKSGGDFTTVKAALASIPNDSTPRLIKIGPGTYDEPGGIDMKGFVDIEGSGRDVTIIQSAVTQPSSGGGGLTPSAVAATVRMQSVFAEIRSLTVRTIVTANAVASWSATGIYISGDSAQVVTDVAVGVSGSETNGAVLLAAGFAIVSSYPSLTHIAVNVQIAGGDNVGVYSKNFGFRGTDFSSFTYSGGNNLDLYNDGGSVLLTGSRLQSSTNVLNFGAGTVSLAASQLDGALVSPGTSCIGSWRGYTFAPVDYDCAPIP